MAQPTHGTQAEVTCPSQTFRISSSGTSPASSIIKINTRLDRRTGQYVIPWKGIRRVFENMQYVKQGDSVVSFVSDDEFERLSPPRITPWPDVVLNVVLKNNLYESLPKQQAELLSHVSQQDTEVDNGDSHQQASNDRYGLYSTLQHAQASGIDLGSFANYYRANTRPAEISFSQCSRCQVEGRDHGHTEDQEHNMPIPGSQKLYEMHVAQLEMESYDGA
ncbi:hypothetical protein BC939DRAFT_521495 [Gamsiella multidivaricata]|uniref:uncharacterized protein n=1 Tax=Gamsiella multidivaricata TaxID=101098 RepID=UPI00221E47AE|nr:uncharacterized protein BC939DRAFT_521495 [Gamsiella multidivaricata]KAI7818772.1 hypothetical protein BC939DRAFT_521495 [Gamsiella multidivaricata]